MLSEKVEAAFQRRLYKKGPVSAPNLITKKKKSWKPYSPFIEYPKDIAFEVIDFEDEITNLEIGFEYRKG